MPTIEYMPDGSKVIVPTMKEAYGWTFNLCINPVHVIEIIVWIGNTQYTWSVKHPRKLQSRIQE